MKLETILNATVLALVYVRNEWWTGDKEKYDRRNRQQVAFRARILRMFAIYRNFAEANGFDRGQAWFWTDEWQAMEQEVEGDIAIGKVHSFDSMEEFLESLEG